MWFPPCSVSPSGVICAGMGQEWAMVTQPTHRIDWVDYAKGICIVLVVMMHSTLGVEKALGQAGALNTFIDWARPFRMPDFFLISGLFLARRIAAPWRDYLDKKVLHFLYFYVLWMTIQFLFKGYGIYAAEGLGGLGRQWLFAFVEPFGTLWFIYLLPVFFVATKLLQRVPPLLVFALAAALEILPLHTGFIMVDEFAARFVYFYVGFWLAGHVFRFADDMANLTTAGLVSALVIWGIAHSQVWLTGLADSPGVSLVLGLVGTGAVVTAGVLCSRLPLGGVLGYLGAHSIVIYLSFFVFMATSRLLALKLAPDLGADVISLVVTAASLIGAALLDLLTRKTVLKYLFIRPAWAKLESHQKVWHGTGHDKPKQHTLVHPQAR
jgi:uncharacterized membrane protein YcfT